MKNILLIISTLIFMSFKSDGVITYHYPCFMMTYDKQIPANSDAAFEYFYNGTFVSNATDYFGNVDSVAVKYLKYKGTSRSSYSTVYTNFYSRKSSTTWNKYDAKRKFMYVIEEQRSDTFYLQHYSITSDILYYKVKW